MARLHDYDQHFLRSPRLVAELVGHSNLRKNDLVYDFGAGSGVITSVLTRRVKQVVAVEQEPKALAQLKRNLAGSQNLRIINQDILSVELPNERYKVFSNIPFSLSSSLLRRLTSADNPPIAIYLIVQKQFARKLEFGQHFTASLGVEISPWFTVRIRKPLRRSDFTPPPNVDTVLLEIKLREQPLLDMGEIDHWQRFISRCFAEQKFFGVCPRAEAGISVEKKPSELTQGQWLSLYKLKSKS